jgi:hypothetical protein
VLGGITTLANASLVALNGSISDAGDAFGGEDVVAAGLRLVAGIGIGAPTDGIETRVDVLSARATSGGIFIEESDALVIDGVGASVERVLADADTTTESDAVQSDVRTTAGDGSIVIRTLGGHLTLNDGAAPADNTVVSAHGAGNVRLEAAGTDTDLLSNADILSDFGHITLMAHRDLRFVADADVTTGGSGTLNLVADQGSVVMDDNVRFSTGSGNVRIAAATDVRLGGVATSGNVSLIAVNGSILDNGDTYRDVIANRLSMNAGVGVGELGAGTDNPIDTEVTTLSARATSGGVNVLEANALIVDAVEVSVQSVGIDAVLTPTVSAEQTGVFTESGNGAIVLQTLTGDITLNDGSGLGAGIAVSANGSGNVLVEALGADTDLTLNSDLLSGTGHINLIATRDVALTAGSAVTTGGAGSVYLEATAGDVTQHDDSRMTSANGDVRVFAAGSIQVGGMTTDANVSLIAQSGSITGGSSAGLVDVEAAGLRLVAGHGVGTAGVTGNALETQVSSISGRGNAGGIRILNTGDLEVAPVAVTVQRVDRNASSGAVTDTAQNDLIISSGGGALLVDVPDGTLTTQGVVASRGTGPVRLAASDGMTLNWAVSADNAQVTLVSDADILMTTASKVEVGGDGSIYIESASGAFTMADRAQLSATNGNIRVFALGDLTLGGVSTSGKVALISTNGAVVSGGLSHTDVTAAALRIEAIGAGTSADALQTRVDVLAAEVGAGGLYLDDGSALLLGAVGLTTDQVLGNGTTQSVIDSELSGVVATGGPVAISSVFNLSLLTVVTNLSATLTSQYGAILNAGTGAPNAQIGGTLTLSAESGIGRTGSGELVIDAGVLTLINNSGSVYLSLIHAVELAGVTLVGSGNLYLNQTLGGMHITAPVSIANGRAVINVFDALLVEADVSVGRDLRVVADSLTVSGSQFVAGKGDIVIRTSGDALFDATSGASAASGTIGIVSGGILTVSDFVAGSLIDLRAHGDILQSGGVLTAPGIRLFSETGNLGTSENPMMTDAGRIDVSSDGDIYISEADGIQIGRSGISNGGTGVNDTVTLNLGDGTLTSATDSIEFNGAGTLVLNSSGELTLSSLVRANNGNVTINADGLRDGTANEGLLLEVRNGRVSIVTVAGVGGAGNADIEIAANELTATTQTGGLELEVEGTTRVVADGLVIFNGAGNLNLNLIAGSLQVDAPIRHGGSGSLNIDLASGNLDLNSLITQTGSGNLLVNVPNGAVNMTSLARIETNSGLLDLRASGSITLSRVSTLSGNIYLESSSGSIRSLANFSGANIISLSRPTVNVDKIAQFTVDSSSLVVNGIVVFRVSGQAYILILVNFS